MRTTRVALMVAFCFVGEAVASPARTFPGKAAPSPTRRGESTKHHPRLTAGLGEVHHPVSTKNQQAQRFFDQGLALIYGFNQEEARRSFEHASELDPKLAMAWWGVALTLGPNINIPVDPEREKKAYEAIQRALALQENASEAERAYINALAFRYSNDAKADLHQLDVAYRDAMSKLVRNYPDDLDAATLYAESAMDLHPWQLWSHEGGPNEDTEEIVAVLESVLKRDPNHLGANHYYIHAVEASPNPERAFASAIRLEKLAPAAGHLTHMPSHIYARTGEHLASARSNKRAIAADLKYFGGREPDVVALMYHTHNVHFLAFAACMSGNFPEAKKAADKTAALARPHIGEMPEMAGFTASFICTPQLVLLAFERWNDILKLESPPPSTPIAIASWHFVRAVAFANLGNTIAAEREQAAWQQLAAKISPEVMVNESNKTGALLKLHSGLISAAIARSRHNDKGMIDFLNQAVAAEDALNYSEPPAFYPPVRPVLGRALLGMKQFGEAEKVLRADLDRNPRDPAALAGLRDCLRAQNRVYDADQVDLQLRQSQKKIDGISTVRSGK